MVVVPWALPCSLYVLLTTLRQVLEQLLSFRQDLSNSTLTGCSLLRFFRACVINMFQATASSPFAEQRPTMPLDSTLKTRPDMTLAAAGCSGGLVLLWLLEFKSNSAKTTSNNNKYGYCALRSLWNGSKSSPISDHTQGLSDFCHFTELYGIYDNNKNMLEI